MTQVADPEIIIEAREATEEAERILVQARGFLIADQSGLEAASAERTRIKQRYNEIEDLRKNLKAPILAAAKNVDDQFRRPLQELTDAVQVIDQAVKGYLAVQERERQAAEARLREIARAEEERLRREAAVEAAKAEELRQRAAAETEAGNLANAARLESRAESAIERSEEKSDAATRIPVPIMAPTVTKTAGLSTRENWEFQILDASKLPREYLMPNEAAIRAVVKGLKGNTNIPGVRVYRDDIVAGRGR